MDRKPFVLPIKTPMGHYFYEVNQNEIIAVNKALFDYIQLQVSPKDDVAYVASETVKMQYDDLKECGYLSSNHVTKVTHSATHRVSEYLDRGLEKITLQVTQGCNLRCKYCIYSEEKNHNQRTHSASIMTLETAKKAIMFYRNHSLDKNKVSIGFYGGEPLLAFPLIAEIVEFSEKVFLGKKITFYTTTNATLLTDKMIEFMADHNFKLTISLDGPKDVQDKNRVFPDGSGSYDVVMNNITRINEIRPELLNGAVVSMVVDSHQNYDGLLPLFNEPALKNVELLYSMVEEDSFEKEPCEEYVQNFNYELFVAFADSLRENQRLGLNKLLSETMTVIEDAQRDFQPRHLSEKTAPSGPCIPGKLRLFVDCFGNFYPCERVDETESLRIGSLDSGFDEKSVKDILNISAIGSDDCINCWAFSLCNICVKRAFDGSKISLDHRRMFCKKSKASAFSTLMDRIATFENNEHLRTMNQHKGGEEK